MENQTLKTIFEHKSIRKYKSTPISESTLQTLLEAGLRASTTGNMQLYSIIVTQDKEQKEALAKYHFNQPMVTQAPLILTFCADVNRFHIWCEQNQAEKSYDNFLFFINACIDTLLVAQNICTAAEAMNLGICYLGTTTYMAKEISDFFQLPEGVVPITTLTIGYPDEQPKLTDRLPLEAVVHYEKYNDYSPTQIKELFNEKESSEETQKLLQENQLPNLAQIFTKNRYPKKQCEDFSVLFLALLKEKGFIK